MDKNVLLKPIREVKNIMRLIINQVKSGNKAQSNVQIYRIKLAVIMIYTLQGLILYIQYLYNILTVNFPLSCKTMGGQKA